MTKRPFCLMAGGMILGILLAALGKHYVILAVIFSMSCIIWITASFMKRKRMHYVLFRMLLFIAAIIIGRNRYQKEWEFQQSYEPMLYEQMQIEVQGKLIKKEIKSDQFVYTLDHCYLNLSTGIFSCNQILVYQDADEYPIGKTLLVNGKVNMWRQAVNEGNFDEKSFYFSRKMAFCMREAQVAAAYGKKDAYQEGLYQLRCKLREIFQTSMEEEKAGILATMVLGDKSLLDTETKELYQKVGISHMLAISGLHVSFIGMAFYKFLRKRKFSYGEAAVVSAIAIVSFGIMSGLGTSTVRAVLMFLLSILAAWIGRSYDSANSLGAAAVLLLLENPFLLWYAGFLFSFAAVGGVIGVGQTLAKARKYKMEVVRNEAKEQKNSTGTNQEKADENEDKRLAKRKRILKSWVDTLEMSMAIQLTTLPLAAYFYCEVPTYSIPVNFILLPFLGYVLLFGLLGGFVGLILPFAAKWCLLPCQFILTAYERVCEMTMQLPGAEWIVGKPSIVKILIFYIILIVVILLVKRWKKSPLILVPMLSLCLLFTGNGGSGFELSMLDVGQGDGIFLRTEDNVTCFMDGGSTDVSKVGTFRILPFLKAKGVGKIDYWFVSHMDEDHVSGLKEAIEAGYRVEHLVFSKWILQDEAFLNMEDFAQKSGIEVLYLEEGDSLHTKTSKFTCIFPTGSVISDDRNALSLVLWYEENGVSALLTGDISSVEETIALGQDTTSGQLYTQLQKYGGVCEIYKAAHHGSQYSNSESLLEALHPEVSLVSCGEHNRYGHPGKEAVEHMEKAGSEVFYTMKSGQIKITREKDQIQIRKYLDKLDVCSYPVVK